jgi:hypothetical protein
MCCLPYNALFILLWEIHHDALVVFKNIHLFYYLRLWKGKNEINDLSGQV